MVMSLQVEQRREGLHLGGMVVKTGWVVTSDVEAGMLLGSNDPDAGGPVFSVFVGDGDKIRRDLLTWKPSNGGGTWSEWAAELYGFVLYMPLNSFQHGNDKIQEAAKAMKTSLESCGAHLVVIGMKPGESLRQYIEVDAFSGKSLQSLINGSGAAKVEEKKEGSCVVQAGSGNRDQVLDDSVDAIHMANVKNKSLFLSDVSLVTVFNRKMVPVTNSAQLSGWCKKNGVTFEVKTKEGEVNRVLAPKDEMNILVNAPWLWGEEVYSLSSLTELPLMRENGTFISDSGYDETTKTYCVEDNVGSLLDGVAEAPTQESAQRAAKWLIEEVFCDFPFVTESDRANVLGLLLGALSRHVFQRPMPLFGVTAPDAGTGKGLLVAACSLILRGRDPFMRTLPKAEEEKRKAITTVLMQDSSPIIVWDNVATGSQVRSETLAMLHTTPEWPDRLLGSNTGVLLANDRVWVATGNNIAPGEDMIRRWVQISLNAGVENPYTRTGFKHKDLKAWVLENRKTCFAALLTILKAWDLAGRPRPAEGTPVMGDYQPFVNVVGGALTFAGVEGFLMNMADVREEANIGSEDEASEDFVHWLYSALLNTHKNPALFNTKQIVDMAEEFDTVATIHASTRVPFPPRIAATVGSGPASMSRAIAHWLKEIKGRRFGPEKMTVAALTEKVGRTQGWAISVEKPVETHPGVAEFLARSSRY